MGDDIKKTLDEFEGDVVGNKPIPKSREFHDSVDVVQFETQMKLALSQALDFLRDNGFGLKTPPTIKFVNRYPDNINQLAAAKVEKEQLDAFTGYLGVALTRLFHESFSLSLSDAAIEEYVSKRDSKNIIATQREDNDVDIVLYRGLAERPELLNQTVFHEIWHCLEKQELTNDSAIAIAEGTTTFAEYLYSNKALPNEGRAGSYYAIAYEECARIVQDELGNHPQPLKMLLDPEFRLRVAQRFHNNQFSELVASVNETTLQHPEVIVNGMAYETGEPYNDFLAKPNKSNYIKALRNKGCNRMADELETQDIGPLLDWICGTG